MLPYRILLCALCVSAVNIPVFADDGWSLTTSDFKRRSANVKSIDETGVKALYYGSAEPVTVPWDKFLQLDRGASTAQPRGAWTLHLLSGDRLGGEPVSLANDTLAWRSQAAGDLAIPLKEIRAIARGQDPVPYDANQTEDVVRLANGDVVKGILSGFDAGKLQVKQASGDALPVDLVSVSRILLASAGKPESSGQRGFRIQLSDGSVLTAPGVAVAPAATQIVLTLNNGDKRPLDLTQVVLIEQLNGPVAWLSARVPDQTVYQPMFDVSYPPQMDRNYKGDRIRFQGREFTRGIGVHAYCKLVYQLDGKFKVLRIQYALNDDVTKGRVTVRILLDDKVVHEAKDFPPNKLSPALLIDLGNAKTLTLEAHPGGDPSTDDRTKWSIDTQSRLNWIEPALLKEKPANDPDPVPVPPTPATKPTTSKPATPKPVDPSPADKPAAKPPEATTPANPTTPAQLDPSKPSPKP